MKCRTSLLFAAVSRALARTCPQRPKRHCGRLTVEGAVAEAVQNNLALLAERANLSIADAALDHGSAASQPGAFGQRARALTCLGTGFDEREPGRVLRSHSVRVDVPFERGDKRDLRIDVAAQKKQVAEARVRRFGAAGSSWTSRSRAIDVLEAKAKLPLAEDNLRAARAASCGSTNSASRSGAIPQLEVTRSRVAMLQYRSAVRTGTAGGERGPAEAAAAARPAAGRGARRHRRSPRRHDSERLRRCRSCCRPHGSRDPDLLALRNDQARSVADLRLEQAQGKVDYTLGAEYRREQGVNGRGNMLGFFVSVPLPFSNRNQGEIARAEAEREKAGRSLRAGETSVAGEVAAAYQEFESARSLLADIERDLLAPTREARASVTYVYQAGATSLLDVLDAQRAFNDTMDTYYSAQAAYRRAQAPALSLTVNKDVLP